MAFQFGDPGGRLYNAIGTGQANLLAWWSSVSNGVNWLVSAGNGRTGGSSLRLNLAGNANFQLIKTLTSQATYGIALAFRISPLPGVNNVAMFGFLDAGTPQIDCRLNSDGTFTITRNGTILGTSSATIGTNTYCHLELKVLFSASAGTVELRKNGTPIIGPLTGLNTKNSANASANQVSLAWVSGNSSTNLTVDYDDIIVWDTQVNDPQGNPDISDFIGDCGLVWLLPTGAGTTTQFTPDSGSNYTRVNEATPDGDTSYVEDGTVGHIDTYQLANLPGNIATVKSMAVVSYTRKSDFSARGMKHELRTNSTNVAHTNEIVLGDSYTYYMSTWGSNPTGTPANWTVADINALEIGRQVSS
jgi:hypothetical protein